ncbi:GAP family protein [Tomitella fengzijianii]|uniref:GAP family protein n=1 Tax=Tomitella fengzijianii TaxID=2597660 RepID=A0A516X6E7_9ACTN|nr:GAP family protein [Tomitella fengzijianii]QDQ98583.1 GAP family protein [Tomitella fengzijianii]
MGGTIGDLLPFAIGIALSPVPIIAVVLMLLAPDARNTGVTFAAGWSVGIVAVAAITSAISAAGGASATDGPSTGSAVARLVVGLLLLALAGRQWQSRSSQSEPKWLASIDKLTPARGGLIGFGLAAVNPKNLLLCIAAGIAVGSAGIGLGPSIVALAVFTVLAAASVVVPVLGFLLAADRLRRPLDRFREWIQASSAQVTFALLLVFGTLLIGKGIGGLT